MENQISELKKKLLNIGVPINIVGSVDEGILIDLYQWCEASKAYYEGDELLMSDLAFDELQKDLLSIDNIFIQEFINSSIYRKGKMEMEHFEQEMISLFKIHWENKGSVSQITKFFAQTLNKKTSEPLIYYSPKYDGCSLKITWKSNLKGNEIESIITRGGIDVTAQLSKMPSIIDTCQLNTKIVCGELLCAKHIFATKYSNEVGGNYENPRNFVGGLVKKTKIPQEIVDDLVFVPCTNGISPIGDSWTQIKNWSELVSLDSVMSVYKSDSFPYLCDGIVIGYVENGTRQVKDNYPLNMVSVKFPATKVRTKVIGFDWTQKKSGKLTPRLILEPVRLDGVTVTAANGYNINFIITNGIGIGSVVEIAKSGEIIPVVIKTIQRSRNIIYPECQYKKVDKHLIAVDMGKSEVFKFVSGLKVLQLQGIGDTISEDISSIVNNDIIEIFNPLNKPAILQKLGNGATWRKFSEIYNIKTIPLDDLIFMLQFDNVGKKTSIKLANIFLKRTNSLSGISSDVISNVLKGKGKVIINNALIKLKSFGISVIKPIEVNDETLTFEMSGSPNGMTKEKFVELLKRKYPNSIHTTLSKNTKILIVDNVNNNTSKILKARKYNIKIATYEDVLK